MILVRSCAVGTDHELLSKLNFLCARVYIVSTVLLFYVKIIPDVKYDVMYGLL